MRLLVLFLLIASTSFGQDSLLFEYVNQYRVANGVAALEYNAELQEISENNTQAMIINDSLMHSGTNTYECATRIFSLAPTQGDLDGFNVFLKKYYNDSYKAPVGNDDPSTEDYILLYVVYSFHSSPAHRAVMLSDDAVIGSCNVSVGDVTFTPNYKVIGGKKIYFNKIISHYKVNVVATLNLNID